VAARHADPLRAIAAARTLRRRELARIASADLLGMREVTDVCQQLTSVWVAVLQAALDTVIRANTPAGGPLGRTAIYGGGRPARGAPAGPLLKLGPPGKAARGTASHASGSSGRAVMGRLPGRRRGRQRTAQRSTAHTAAVTQMVAAARAAGAEASLPSGAAWTAASSELQLLCTGRGRQGSVTSSAVHTGRKSLSF